MKKQQEKRPEKNKKVHKVLILTVVISLVLALLGTGFLWYEMYRYENGILDVCAMQQDAYVQLVIDQINLKDNRSHEEIITDILSTMDASSNKYWTFSSSQAMLFVKDVLETNKYKGFTMATYYTSDSARQFLESLHTGRVVHATIVVSDQAYIASGASFEYAGDTYRLCLLTNRSVLLDNNRFLGPKVELTSLFGLLLILLVLVPILFALRLNVLQSRAEQDARHITALNNSLVKLNHHFAEMNIYSAGNDSWAGRELPVFLEKLEKRKVSPVTCITVTSATHDDQLKLLRVAGILFGSSVLRFEDSKLQTTFLCIRFTPEQAYRMLAAILEGANSQNIRICTLQEGQLRELDLNTLKGGTEEYAGECV